MSYNKKITTGSLVLMAIAFVAWIVWLVKLFSFAIPVFTEDRYWQNLGMVEDHIEIGWFPWLAYFALWAGIFLFGSLAFKFAFRLMNCYRKGAYFTPQSVQAIQHMGLALVLTMFWDTLVDYWDHSLLTWNNTGQGGTMPDGTLSAAKMYLAPNYHYDSGDVALFLCGLGFYLIGYVLDVAQRIEAENKEIV